MLLSTFFLFCITVPPLIIEYLHFYTLCLKKYLIKVSNLSHVFFFINVTKGNSIFFVSGVLIDLKYSFCVVSHSELMYLLVC